MKKILSIMLAVTFSLTLLVGVGVTTKAKAATKTIKVFQLKVEIKDVLPKLAADYEKETGVKIEFETVGGGADYGAALMAKFQSGDEPDIFNTTGYANMDLLQDKLEDLTNQPWVKNMVAGAGDGVTKNGKIYGQPQTIEGFGFAYNKDLFAKAGIKKLPKTIAELEAACVKLKGAKIQPFSNSYHEWWVLGIHNITLLLSQQSNPDKFIKGIANGTVKLKNNPVTAGWLKLLDLTNKYGQKNSYQVGDYKSSVTQFAAGKAAMIQQGTWIQADLDKINPKLNVGFLPMPTTNVAAKNRVYVGVPQYWAVNKKSPVKKEAKDFLNWLVSSKTGKNYIVKEFKFIPAFKTIEAKGLSPLNAALNEQIKAKNTYIWQFAKLPTGASNLIGDSMMKYLGGQIKKDKLLTDIEKAIIDKSVK